MVSVDSYERTARKAVSLSNFHDRGKHVRESHGGLGGRPEGINLRASYTFECGSPERET